MVSVLFLCTGNATRSVLAEVGLAHRRPDLTVASAGTLVLPGLPMSWRTRAAFEAVGLPVPDHRSAQADAADLAGADVIVGLAPEHVAWVRREHPESAARAVTLVRLVNRLAALGPVEGGEGATGVTDRLAAMDAAAVELEPWEEVADPGGGEVEEFIACAHRVDALVAELALRL